MRCIVLQFFFCQCLLVINIFQEGEIPLLTALRNYKVDILDDVDRDYVDEVGDDVGGNEEEFNIFVDELVKNHPPGDFKNLSDKVPYFFLQLFFTFSSYILPSERPQLSFLGNKKK